MLREVPRSTEVPGYILIEEFALQGIRVCVSAGCLATTAYFYLFHRPRLSFADRSLARLHHYFTPSIGYTTPLGALGGIALGLCNYQKETSVERLAKEYEKEVCAAQRAETLHDRKRDAITSRARKHQSLWKKMKVHLRFESDPAEEALARYGLQNKLHWEDTLSPFQFASISLHSTLIQGSDPCKHANILPGSACGRRRVENNFKIEEVLSTLPGASNGGPTANGLCKNSEAFKDSSASPRFSKLQFDHLVSRALYYRLDETYERWSVTARRGGTCGIVASWLLWKTKASLLFRTSVGFGFGVVMGGIISSIKLDEAFAHLK